MLRIVLATVVGLATVAGRDVRIQPRFVDADEFTIAMTYTLDERLDDRRTHTIQRTVRIRVLATSAGGTVLQWRPGPAEVKGTPVGAGARMAVAVLATAEHDFELALDENGQFRRILNISDLAASLERARDAVRVRVPAIDHPSLADLPPITAPMIASSVGQDAEVFTGFFGMTAPVAQEVTMPAPFRMPGGDIPGVRRLRIVSANEDTAELAMTFAIDAEALRKQFPQAATEPLRGLDLTETARHVFDRRVGLHRSGTLERVAVSGSDRRVEGWTFSMTSPPKR